MVPRSNIPNICLALCLLVLLFSCKNKEVNVARLVTSEKKYTEQHRPQYHFTPDSMWMNDPNGLVYLDGEYHLFYQYYPDSIVWGPMHWGHAVSEDLVHWKHLPIALFPDSLGLIFSGSAVIDQHNTAGFGKDAMVAIFTHHNMDGEQAGRIDFQNQSIAYSLDKGRTFTKYTGNPVVKNPGIKDFRDPKVIWYEKTKSWIMVVAAYDKAIFYTSKNLKEWKLSGEFGIKGDTRLWECPDLFPIKTEGSQEEKWVLITSIQKEGPNGGTATSYFVGDFDGKKFVGDSKNQKWLDYGTDNYALVTWSNVPDGRTLGIGWMSNWQYAQQVPTQRWRSAMTLPRTLKLLKENGEYTLRSLPVEAFSSIQRETKTITTGDINKEMEITPASIIDLSFSSISDTLVVRFYNEINEYLDLGYISATKTCFIDRKHAGINDFSEVFAANHTAPRHYSSDTLSLKICLDHSSVELFGDEGTTSMTDIFFPTVPYTKMKIIGNATLLSGKISAVNSIWNDGL